MYYFSDNEIKRLKDLEQSIGFTASFQVVELEREKYLLDAQIAQIIKRQSHG